MSLIHHSTANVAETAMVPRADLERAVRERDQARAEADRHRARCERLETERTAIFAALTNGHLTAPERIDGLLTLFEAHAATPKADGSRPVCITAVANRAARSPDAVKKDIDRLAGYGFCETKTVKTFNVEQNRPEASVTVRLPSDDLVDNLRQLARLAPSEEQRAAVTEKVEGKARTKPGPTRGERREKLIKARCPQCGSDHTSLECMMCGMSFPTVDLPDEAGESHGSVTYGIVGRTPGGGTADTQAHDSVSYGTVDAEPLHNACIEDVPNPDCAEEYTYISSSALSEQAPWEEEPEWSTCSDSVSYGIVDSADEGATRDRGSHGSVSYGIGVDSNGKWPTLETAPLDAALMYARMGWHVFPLAGKDRQLVRSWKEQATTNPETIRGWWRSFPDANVGIACGPSGIVVIDVDEEGYAGWRNLEHARRLPATLTAKTGGGGVHAVFQAPAHIRLGNGTGDLPAGIDVRGHGGYIVAAPSLHPTSGKRYEWIPETRVSIEALPRDLLQLISPPPKRRDGYSNTDGPLDPEGPVIHEGSRNEDLFTLASKWRYWSAGVEEIAQALHRANELRCIPPLPAREVEGIARSVGRYPPGEP